STDELGRLWSITMRGVQVIEPAPLAGSLVQSVNEVIDLAESRRTTFMIRLPRVVLFAVIAFALVTAALGGFTRGGRRHFGISLFIYLMLSTAIALIIDLDRPSAGAIRLVPGPLADTRAGMTASIVPAEAVPARP
ncbi:MAG: hypothetical protein ACK4TG_10495, partial [Thermaurantiacus sp.]